MRLGHDLFPSGVTVVGTGDALKQLDQQLFFRLLVRHAQGGFQEVAGFGAPAKMFFKCDDHHVIEYCQRHGANVRISPAIIETNQRFLPALLKLLVFTFGFRHGFWLKLFGGTVEADKQAPSGQQDGHGHQYAGCIGKL